jgi:hypothetical protein
LLQQLAPRDAKGFDRIGGRKVPSNNETLDAVLSILNNTGDAHYHIASYLVTTHFCANDNATAPTIPSVGLTTYGPSFFGQTDVTALFTEIFNSFPDFAFNVVPPRYNSAAGIAIRGTISGTQKKSWFHMGNPHYSKPISDIYPAGNKKADVPACAIVSFDAFEITNLMIYFDRYIMNQQLK